MTSRDAALQELRMKYKTAEAAHENSQRSLSEAIARGETPSTAQLDGEATAAREMYEARSRFLVAIASG
jgi:hypothetical protein